MKRQLLFFLLLLQCTILLGQNPNRITLKGLVYDTAGTSLPYATVMLLNPKDSTLINFTRGDENAAFEFKNLKNVPYLLKVSYVGYLPYQQQLDVSAESVRDVGKLQMKLITKELLEVVVKAARSTLSIRGDTIEYDASSFKVPPGSTVEDLLRRLPGIELDADGNIKAQGKEVKRVYVDGKTFFGDDPKSATRNLGAETISKVQVYNEKSEQAKLTGVDDGKKEKAMNLELKEEYKKGAFGKITGAIGTEERWAGRGNYNRFNKTEQFSIIGFANNINQTGVNWEDYSEFKGENTFGDYDNGDFGFSNGGGRYYYFSDGGGDGLTNYFDGRGFTENGGGGVNYNFNNKKTKVNANYTMNQTRLTLDQFAQSQTFLSDSSFFNTDTLNNVEFRRFHGGATRFEHEIDSNNLFIIKAEARFGYRTNDQNEFQAFRNESNLLTNTLDINNDTKMNSWRVNTSGIFRHRFSKKGRSFALSAGYNNSQTDNEDYLNSVNRLYLAAKSPDPIQQLNNRDMHTVQIKSSLLFTEPITKRVFWESFYNFNRANNTVDQQVNDRAGNNERIDLLSVFYDNKITYNRLGSSVRYSHEGLNASAGLAAQSLNLYGAYAQDKNSAPSEKPIDRTYNNLTPNLSVGYEFPNNVSVYTDYTYNVEQPRINDLQPTPNVSNPAFRIEGNPDLQPTLSHSVNVNLNYWNPAALSNVGVGAEYNYYDRQIAYNRFIEFVDSVGYRTTTTPVNVKGGNRVGGYSWMNFPIIKTKLTMYMNLGFDLSNTPVLVNGTQNETRNKSFNMRPGFNLTPNPKLVMGFGGNAQLSWVSYSVDASQNQNIQNYGAYVSTKWNVYKKLFFESNFDYSKFKNDRLDLDQNIPLWNASLRHLFGKQNRLELRLAAFDLLNRRLTVQQNGFQNIVSSSIAPTLTRYFMLSATYNVRGFETKLNKNNWW